MPVADRIKARLRAMDSRAIFMIGMAFFAFGTALTLIIFGSAWLALEGEGDVAAMISSVDDPLLAPLAVVLVYVGLGALGAPQFLLQAAAIVVFGPWLGFAYAWGATLVSSSVFYWAGHFAGAQALRRFAGVRVNAVSEALGRHGILATGISRVVPTVPFVILNMAFGASHVNFGKFLIGTGLGTIPKVAVVAYVGASLGEFLASRDPMDLALMALILLLWVGFAWWMRGVLRRSGWQKAVDDAVETPDREDQSAT